MHCKLCKVCTADVVGCPEKIQDFAVKFTEKMQMTADESDLLFGELDRILCQPLGDESVN